MKRAYENLANAIIKQACEDYINLGNIPASKSKEKRDILKFFHSNLFSSITSLRADWLIEQLDEKIKIKEANQNGKKNNRRRSINAFL